MTVKNRLFIVLFFLLGFCSLSAQQANNVLATNVTAGSQLLELNLDSSIAGTYFTIAIVKNQRGLPKNFYAREGTHYYDLRDLDTWNGQIEYVVTNLPKNVVRSSRMVNASLFRNWDAFLYTNMLSLKTVNFSEKKVFAQIPFTLILLGITAICSLLLIFVGKKEAIIAIFLGILLSIVLMDAREMVDRWRIADAVEQTYPLVSPHSYVQGFLAAARPLMEGGAWTFRGKFNDEYYKLCIRYKLTDLYYYPEHIKRIVPPPGTFVITQQAPLANEEVLVQENGFYLIKML